MNNGPRPVEVDCRFAADGSVRVRRVRLDGRWQVVEQGRQWADDAGRHVLVMLTDGRVVELLLAAASLRWEIQSLPPARRVV